jgi:sulfate adenylyltransferase subunit 1
VQDVDRYESEDGELLRFLTAGSVDDGKSTLIGRLLHDSKAIFEDQLAAVERSTRRRGAQGVDLSLFTDGLQAEREQGITIDVAYRYFSTPKRKFIIADSPGHEQYTRNMVTAASTASLALILIDARKGVVTQSCRHAYIAALLGIPRVVVAVNKMDLVNYSKTAFDAVREAFSEFASDLKLRDLIFIPISALKGDMVVERGGNLTWYDGAPLLELLENMPIEHNVKTDGFRFPVQWVCRPGAPGHSEFRGYTGRIEAGSVAVGDSVTVLPSGRTSRIKQITTFDGNLEYAFAPQSVTLILADEIDISRGDMIVNQGSDVRVVKEYDADICWLGEAAADVRRKYIVKQSTKSVKAKIARIDYRIDVNSLRRIEGVTELKMNEIARVGIKVQQPLVIDSYASDRAVGSFIMIDEITNDSVAAGMIV